MNEKLPEAQEIEDRGFRTALFINLNRYDPNCMTPQKDAMDNFDKLSIESSSPVTTPKSHEKRQSNFKFCLSQDLLRRLEEESPIRSSKEDDFELGNCLFALEDEEIENQSTKNENNSDCSSEPNGQFRRPVINSFSTNNATSDSEYILTPHKNDSFTENSESNVKSKSIGKVTEKKIPLAEDPISLNNFNDCDKNNCEDSTVGCKTNSTILTSSLTNISKTTEEMCLGSKNNKFNNISQNYMINSSFYNNPYMLLYANMNSGNNMNYNYGVGTININGKNGWICLICNNFNYESKNILLIYELVRVKCNRCSKPRPQLLNQNVFIEKNQNDNNDVNNSEENNKFCGTSKSLGDLKSTSNNNNNKKKKPFQEREGDWNCFKCKNLNFSFRVICNRCQLSKKESESLTSLNQNLKRDDSVINSARPKIDCGKISV